MLVVEVVEEDEAEAVEEESDWDFIASNRSCINLPRACAGFSVEDVDDVDDVEVVEDVNDVDEVDEVDEVELTPASGGDPPGGGGIEIPIWFNACMTLCISPPSPESEDPLLDC